MRSATIAFLVLSSLVFAASASARPAGAGGADAAEMLGEAYRAFEAADYRRAFDLADAIDRERLVNDDYALYVMAQSAYLLGDHPEALRRFRQLRRMRRSRFRSLAAWRIADTQWQLDRRGEAVEVYRKLLRRDADAGDPGVARFRIAVALADAGDKRRAARALRAFLREHPAHALAPRAERRLHRLVGAAAPSARQRIERAKALKDDKAWHEAIAELRTIGDDVDGEIALLRDYWTARTLYSMRRQYRRAGDILLRIYRDLDDEAAWALFHGARALSRADYDKQAIEHYQQVVDEFPRTRWAAEAEFLSGWLEFNMGNYALAIPYLEKTRDRYPRSVWAAKATWFQALCHYLLGQYDAARPLFSDRIGGDERLEDGKARYWTARTRQRLGDTEEANAGYREVIERYPLSWYALLARARLESQGIEIGPFGDDPRDPDEAADIADEIGSEVEADPLIRSADELLEAGLGVEAGEELRRRERAFIRRHDRAEALAALVDRYHRGGDYNRPWLLAVVYGGRAALDAPPKGDARAWWKHAYPRAFRELIEKWRHMGDSPPYYLNAIMRKESGFDPHVWSYADAIGLLQMIPPTTRRVAAQIGLEYTDDLLYDPELNIRTGSWYIGRLLQKFKDQIPLGAGSFNSGPSPVMRWCDLNGEHPTDVFVELVSYRQTRGYMKKVTETYARYLYLYEGAVYEQPLELDCDYVDDQLTY